jgi:HK97 family phage prohead protease
MKKNNGIEPLPDLYRIKGMATHQHCEFASMVKDVDVKNGIITGYFSAFNNVDSDNEIVVPGAFRRSIRERGPSGSNRVAFLRQHRPELLLGRPTVLKEDKTGLYFESKISPTSYGKDTMVLYQDGVINEHSIGYDVVKQERTQDEPTRLLELRLWDGSAVTWGANDQTPFLGFKSVKDWSKAFDQIDNINRALTDVVTDDTAMTLEIWIRQFQQGIMDFAKSLVLDDPRIAAIEEASQKASRSEIASMLRKQIHDMESLNERLRQ